MQDYVMTMVLGVGVEVSLCQDAVVFVTDSSGMMRRVAWLRLTDVSGAVIVLVMETVSTSETSVNFYSTSARNPLFRMFFVQISARRLAALTEVSRGFSQSLQASVWIVRSTSLTTHDSLIIPSFDAV
jgi:hypothetical protein